MKFNPNPKPYRPKPMRANAPMFPQRPKPQEEAKEEPYWTAQQWEEWATNIYNEYEDALLPEWFIKAMETEEK